MKTPNYSLLDKLSRKNIENHHKKFVELYNKEKINVYNRGHFFDDYPFVSVHKHDEWLRKLMSIAYHFSIGKTQSEFDNTSVNATLTTLPKVFHFSFTWEDIDLLEVNWFTYYGYCFFCQNFCGHRKGISPRNFHRLKKNKIIPLFGTCKQGFKKPKNGKVPYRKDFTSFSNVVCSYRCKEWIPTRFIGKIIEYKIDKKKNEKDKFSKEFIPKGRFNLETLMRNKIKSDIF